MTVDEIRARNSAADWSQQQAQDIRYLLTENERLARFEAVARSLSEHSPMISDDYGTWCFFCGAKLHGKRVAHDSDCVWIRNEEAPQPDNAIPTQLGRNSDAIAAEKER